MSFSILAFLTVLLIIIAAITPALRLFIATRGKSKQELYNFLYSADWGDITINNYGFAPTCIENPQKFQLQMYEEVYKRLQVGNMNKVPIRLLEISCGRGGGLEHVVNRGGGGILGVGLDWSENAISFCRRRYAANPDMAFIRGTALQLPFRTASFDAIINVEASNDYGDEVLFLKEVRRVLRPDAQFIYVDSRSPRRLGILEQRLVEAGFDGKLVNITNNIVRACLLDSDRRRRLIRNGIPWYTHMFFKKRLMHWAGIEGSRKFDRLLNGQRIYFISNMTIHSEQQDQI